MSILNFEEFLNEKSKGLWHNIRKKRAEGRKPARKGSKAYNKAVKAAKEIGESKKLNESDSWEAKLEIAKKRKGSSTQSLSRKFGLAEDSPYQRLLGRVWEMITNGSIYGSKIPSYPCVIAVSGIGDDYGNDEAWLIKSQEDLFRWIFSVCTYNKMFPDLSRQGYNEVIEGMEAEEVDDLIEYLNEVSASDDFSNGYTVEFFQNEEAMKERIKETNSCYSCEGSGKDEEGEECEDCGGSGQTDPDQLESHEAYPEIIDGSLFPDRKLTTNW